MSANHGNTPAAWTAVAIAIVGSAVAGIGVIALNWVTFWVGIVLVPIGVVVGGVMSKMGMGSRTGH